MSSVPPYIDGVTGIVRNGTTWEADPALWNRTASVMVRGSAYGETVARIKIRMEGKGDPVGVQVPQQTMFVYDNSGSMGWNDPSRLRCAAMSSYVDKLSLPSEIGAVQFESTATLVHGLSTDYASVKSSLNCAEAGATNIHEGLRLANDQLIANNKSGYAWAEILLTDGLWNSGGDPRPEVDRAALNRIRVFTICLGGQCNLADLNTWANITGGKFYNVQNASDLDQVYTEIAGWLSSFTGSAPGSGDPMIVFKFTDDIEIVPGSLRCDSASCSDPNPNNSAAIVDGNRGLRLEWYKPLDDMFIGWYWQIELGVRGYIVSNRTKVNDPLASHISYDRYDRTPGGDALEQLYLETSVPVAPRVIWTSPLDGMSGVPGDWPVEVRFDLAMDQASIASSFSMSPPIAGGLSTGPDSLRFDHPGNFTPGTRYDVTIATLAKSALGVPMSAPYGFSFNTTPAPLPPRVIATDPSNSANDVPIGHSVTVVFDQAMDPVSTSAAFSSDRPVPGSVVSVNGRELQWTHDTPFDPFATYDLRISGSATSLTGVAMGSAYSFRFTTGGTPWVPRVVTTDPYSGEADVERGRPVQVLFDVAMDPGTTVGAFSIIPEPALGAVSVAGQKLLYSHSNDFAEDTAYTVVVSDSATSAAGVPLGAAYIFTFRTKKEPFNPAPEVSMLPQDGAKNVSRDTTIVLIFTQWMDPNSVESAISIEPAVVVKETWDTTGRVLTLQPAGPLAAETLHNVHVDAKAQSAAGVPLLRPFASSFTTAKLAAGGPGPQPIPEILTGSGSIGWAALGILVLLLAVLSIILLVRLKRRRDRQEEERTAKKKLKSAFATEGRGPDRSPKRETGGVAPEIASTGGVVPGASGIVRARRTEARRQLAIDRIASLQAARKSGR